jgi:transposase
MEAQAELEGVLHQAPLRYGIQRSRWRLADLGEVIGWLHGRSVATIQQVVKRLGFARKQVQRFVRSPDPEYRAKWQAILRAFSQALARPGEVVFLLLDEFTYYRLPVCAPVYAHSGPHQPRIRGAVRANTRTRIAAVLNADNGQVHYLQRSTIGAEALIAFYATIRQAYPNAHTIYLVQDNWPTHKLPAVLDAASQQRLTPLFLPTYASWLNPIEKLWRWLRQDILHAHALPDELDQLRRQVRAFLDQFAHGSQALLRYTGLLLDYFVNVQQIAPGILKKARQRPNRTAGRRAWIVEGNCLAKCGDHW